VLVNASQYSTNGEGEVGTAQRSQSNGTDAAAAAVGYVQIDD